MSKSSQVAAVSSVKGKKERASKTRLRLWLQLLKTTRQIEGELKDRLRNDHGSTLPRFDVLAALYRFAGGLKMSEISSELKVSNGNVTGIVDRLAAEGLVVRVPVDGDRRALLVKLTKKGREQFTQLAAEHESWVDQMLESVSVESAELWIQQLGDLLQEAKSKEE